MVQVMRYHSHGHGHGKLHAHWKTGGRSEDYQITVNTMRAVNHPLYSYFGTRTSESSQNNRRSRRQLYQWLLLFVRTYPEAGCCTRRMHVVYEGERRERECALTIDFNPSPKGDQIGTNWSYSTEVNKSILFSRKTVLGGGRGE